MQPQSADDLEFFHEWLSAEPDAIVPPDGYPGWILVQVTPVAFNFMIKSNEMAAVSVVWARPKRQ